MINCSLTRRIKVRKSKVLNFKLADKMKTIERVVHRGPKNDRPFITAERCEWQNFDSSEVQQKLHGEINFFERWQFNSSLI